MSGDYDRWLATETAAALTHDTTETESPCDFHCGYVSSGLDLWLHVMHEHARCPHCGNSPIGVHSVIHEADCPRLQPGYVYPGPVPAEFEDEECE